MSQIAYVPNILTGYRFLVALLLLFCLYPGAETWVCLFGFGLYTSGLVIAAGRLGKWKSVVQFIALGTLMFPPGVLPIPFFVRVRGLFFFILPLC